MSITAMKVHNDFDLSNGKVKSRRWRDGGNRGLSLFDSLFDSKVFDS